ncbi:acetyl-CoA synthetase-like protein [Lindgomyces ingoldianus]|uniref:Acetyl-CoA synthetase-like protein n=1 Tax=Lindgomyces ingoldianus TaxID=673940 RepID=A0ACB6QQR6_9PLEO|nr:acetyl-CoA synthetase-like protein [Lindgomyces ingoldianus]KAF2469202.1 acetyl-CoA synthetase-like protein [Lindgomyces ingoldianus]
MMGTHHGPDFILPPFDPTSPPALGTPIKTVAELIDFNADKNANYLFCLQAERAVQGAKDSTFLPITFKTLRDLIFGCQQWLRENIVELQLPNKNDQGTVARGKPIALLVDSDIGLLIHFFAFVGLGIPVLLLSSRLSPLAIQSLLLQTSSNAILTSSRLEGAAKEAVSLFENDGRRPTLYRETSYQLFMRPQTSQIIASEHHYVADNDRNVLILHSSGTTGLPKAVFQSHRYLLSYAPFASFDFEGPSDLQKHQTIGLSTLPLYHAFGLMAPMMSLSIGKPFAIAPPAFVPSAASTVELLTLADARSLLTVPSLLQDITELPENVGLEVLRKLQYVASGGGPLGVSVGSKLSRAGVKLINGFGSTEVGSVGRLQPPGPDNDWRYFRLRKDLHFKITAIDPPTVEDEERRYKISTRPPGWDSDFEMGDYFVTSLKKTGRDFMPTARVDDVIVLKTGEKVSPHILETMLMNREDVRAAIAFGHGRFEIGVLVEPSAPILDSQVEEFKNRLWGTIVHAGSFMDAQAQISSPAAVVVLRPDQKFPRSDKASILREFSYEMFRSEIEDAYVHLDKPLAQFGATNDVEENLLDLIQRNIWKSHLKPLKKTEDLFELGMDSLQATQLRRHLFAELSKRKDVATVQTQIRPDIVYQYPSIAKLATYLSGGVCSGSGALDHGSLLTLIEQYVGSPLPTPDVSERNATVLITGASGALGAHILAQLTSMSSVERIICLNRPGADKMSPYARQFKASKLKGAYIPLRDADKIEILEANTALPCLGLSQSTFWGLATSITHIIHNAWPVDFKRTVTSFEAQFRIMSNLLELALNTGSRTKFLFVSSIAVVSEYDAHRREDEPVFVPEQPFQTDWSLPNMGYGQSKLVCEKMLERVVNDGMIDGVVVRFGQISGAISNGYWNPAEYVPRMVANSKRIGALPELPGTLSWLPLENAASTVTDILFAPPKTGREGDRFVYHVENPSRQSWDSVMATISETLNLRLTPFENWLNQLQNLNTQKEIHSRENAVGSSSASLQQFFETDFIHVGCGNLCLDTTFARRISPSLNEAEAISKGLVEKYVKFK